MPLGGGSPHRCQCHASLILLELVAGAHGMLPGHVWWKRGSMGLTCGVDKCKGFSNAFQCAHLDSGKILVIVRNCRQPLHSSG